VLDQAVVLGEGFNTLYIGKVVAFHLDDEIFDGRYVDVSKLRPLEARDVRYLIVKGRLKPGVDLSEAQAELVARRWGSSLKVLHSPRFRSLAVLESAEPLWQAQERERAERQTGWGARPALVRLAAWSKARIEGSGSADAAAGFRC